MAPPSAPRYGSLQFWPRKRAAKVIPSANWKAISSSSSPVLGFIGYKVGMRSAFVKDLTPHAMTKDKKIIIPITILECPPLKIFSVRFYKNGKVMKEILADNIDKEMKRKVKLPKPEKGGTKLEDVKEYDDIRIIVYNVVKKTNVKKTPDLIEVALSGRVEEKFAFVKANIGKEISILDVFKKGALVDIRGVTKGHGLTGPVKRMGITLRSHKAEKGRRRPGSLGPWHPARVTFRVAMAGQYGFFSRIDYNHQIIDIGKADQKQFSFFNHFGDIKSDYAIIRGSIQGPAKRPVLLTAPLRPSKKQSKKQFEFLELR